MSVTINSITETSAGVLSISAYNNSGSGFSAVAVGKATNPTTRYGVANRAPGNFSVIVNIGCGGTAYVRGAWSTNGSTWSYGSNLTETLDYCKPAVNTLAVLNITITGATLSMSTSATPAVTAKSIELYTAGGSFIKEYNGGAGNGTYTVNATGLTEGASYKYRGKAVNAGGTTYGAYVNFTTTSRPTVTTQAVSSILTGSATGNGNVTIQGSTAVTDRGVCWNTTGTPTIADNHSHSGSGLGAFTSPITGLTEGQTYYVRAFATNSAGTNYGTVVTFIGGITAPVLTGGTDTGSFPNLGWSGVTNTPTWTGATHIRWYHKVSTAPSYTLIDTVVKSTLTKQYLGLLPNTSYSFYCTYYKTGLESSASNVVTINNSVSLPTATYSNILMI